MKKYEIALENKKGKIYFLISWLIIAFNLISFLYLAFVQAPEKPGFSLLAAALILVIIFFGVIMKTRFPKGINMGVYFLVIIVSWLIMEFYWVSFINLVLFFFHTITKRKLVVLFFEERIVYPSFPKRYIHWQDLNNVVLKNGLLTIDLKNNRLFQNEIISVVNEIEFNDFCNKEMHKTRPGGKDNNDFYDALPNTLNLIN